MLRSFILYLMIRVLFQDWMQFSEVLILSISPLVPLLLFKNWISIYHLNMILLLALFSIFLFSLRLYTCILYYFHLLFLFVVEFTKELFERVLLVKFIVRINAHGLVIARTGANKSSLFLIFKNLTMLTLTYI